MAKQTSGSNSPQRPPATSVEGRENQLIALAYDLAEQQLRDGTASSQVMTQFLKMGTAREQLEREKIASDNKLSAAKIEALEGAQRMEELYTKAIKAFSTYQGHEQEDDDVY